MRDTYLSNEEGAGIKCVLLFICIFWNFENKWVSKLHLLLSFLLHVTSFTLLNWTHKCYFLLILNVVDSSITFDLFIVTSFTLLITNQKISLMNIENYRLNEGHLFLKWGTPIPHMRDTYPLNEGNPTLTWGRCQ